MQGLIYFDILFVSLRILFFLCCTLCHFCMLCLFFCKCLSISGLLSNSKFVCINFQFPDHVRKRILYGQVYYRILKILCNNFQEAKIFYTELSPFNQKSNQYSKLLCCNESIFSSTKKKYVRIQSVIDINFTSNTYLKSRCFKISNQIPNKINKI